jgi:hypothetical protein
MSNSGVPKNFDFEIKKTIEVNKTMTLLDLNGSKKNFLTEFIIIAKDPTKKYLAVVTNQDDLDKGILTFEQSEEQGKYSRKVIYQENEHLNHYIAIKKLLDDKSPDPILCDVIIQLQELPAIEQSSLRPSPEEELNEQNETILDEKIDPRMREELTEEFSKLTIPQSNDNTFTFGIICLIVFVVLVSYKFLKK